MAESLSELLEEAARRYAADPDAAGCLVLEGAHANDPEARAGGNPTSTDGSPTLWHGGPEAGATSMASNRGALPRSRRIRPPKHDLFGSEG
ncbi:MAG: hypothetical protein P4M00_01465 [Azospirillaceae bacterium]|nr:hypothetical protein [Azospirillaceae bacterium]